MEIEIKSDEIDVLTSVINVFEFTDATDRQQAALLTFHCRLARAIAQQYDCEQFLETRLADTSTQSLTVEMPVDDVETYCEIAADLTEPFPGGQPRGGYDNEVFHHWRMISEQWSNQVPSQDA